MIDIIMGLFKVGLIWMLFETASGLQGVMIATGVGM